MTTSEVVVPAALDPLEFTDPNPSQEGDISSTQPVRSKTQTFIILSGLFLALFISALDFTVVSPALPTISYDLHSAAGYTWIGSAYLLANAAVGPVWGKLSDIWGRKNILLAAISVFFTGSLICALSTGIAMLIVGRAVQGSAAGGIVILVNVCISDLFKIEDRGLYLGLTGILWAFAGGVGPVIGGVLTQKVSWRWLWWINLPVCGTAFVIIFFFVNVKTSQFGMASGLKRIDWLGSISIVGIVVMFLLGLDFGGTVFPWSSPRVICLITFGLLLIGVFLFSEAKVAQHPVMPLSLFSRQQNVGALLVTFCHGFTYIAASYFLPIYFQAVGLQSPTVSGLMILPIAVIQSATNFAAGLWIKKTGRYLELIRVGMVLLTLGFGLFLDLDRNFSIAKCCIFETIAGLGVGLVFNGPLIALQKAVGEEGIATATATFGFARNMASALSVVIGGVVFQNYMDSKQGYLAKWVGKETAQMFSGSEAGANIGLIKSLPMRQKMIVQALYALGTRELWILYTTSAALGLAASFLMRKAHLKDMSL